MESHEIIVGLDIGTTKIAVIVGRKDANGKIEILGHGCSESLGVMRGSVFNIDLTVESIKKAVTEAELRSGVEIRSVHVGIAGQHIKSFQQRGEIIRDSAEDEISQKDVDLLIEKMYKIQVEPGEKIIHVIPQEYIVDKEHGITKPVGMSGITLAANFHIITGDLSAIKNIFRSVEKAGLQIESIILEPLASADAVLDYRDKEAGVVLVDIGGGTTDVAIFHDNILLHTAVIPLGGNIITEDIQQGCTIVRTQAEELKRKYGSALQSENKDEEIVAIPGIRGRAPKEITLRNLAGIIQCRMEEILEQVVFEIKNSGYEKRLIAGIVVTGGGAMLKHTVQLTEFVTGMDTRIGYPNEHLAQTAPKEMENPIYATGVGLVIQGIKDSEDSEEEEIITIEETTIVETSQTIEEKPVKKEPKAPKLPKVNLNLLDKLRGFFEDDGVM